MIISHKDVLLVHRNNRSIPGFRQCILSEEIFVLSATMVKEYKQFNLYKNCSMCPALCYAGIL